MTLEEPPAKYDREYEVALYRRYGLDLDELRPLERPLESSGVVGNRKRRKRKICLYVYYVACIVAGIITGVGLGFSDEQLLVLRSYFF